MPSLTLPAEPRKRPRQARAAATVDAIVEAAARILETKGLEALNTNAVAEAAGVSIGSLYQYFPAKTAIVAELIRRKRGALLADLGGVTAELALTDIHAFVDSCIEVVLRHHLPRPALVRVLDYAEGSLGLDAETAALKRDIVAVVAQGLSRYGRADVVTAARDLVGLTRGMVDAAGLLGPAEADSLKQRIGAAAKGYLDRRA